LAGSLKNGTGVSQWDVNESRSGKPQKKLSEKERQGTEENLRMNWVNNVLGKSIKRRGQVRNKGWETTKPKHWGRKMVEIGLGKRALGSGRDESTSPA